MSTITFPTIDARPVGARPSVARAEGARLRITRRGRLVLGSLLVVPAAIALAVSALAGGPAQAGSSASTTTFEHITVASGESLWDLAGWIAPEADPRVVVDKLVALNQLPTTEVQPGQRLAIPAEYAH